MKITYIKQLSLRSILLAMREFIYSEVDDMLLLQRKVDLNTLKELIVDYSALHDKFSETDEFWLEKTYYDGVRQTTGQMLRQHVLDTIEGTIECENKRSVLLEWFSS